MTRLVLASSSPRRAQLLAALGIPFDVVPSDVDESGVRGTPYGFALEVARAKALVVAARLGDPERVVLGADTVVVLDGEVLGKPRDEEDARRMLRALSGREHTVITAFALARPPGELLHEDAVESRVEFKRLTEREIRGYVATGEPMDKAGAYGAQGIGSFLLRAVYGSYSSVVGLPVCEVLEVLERLGVARVFPDASDA